MKIALVRPNFDCHIITPPLGLGYLSSYLKRHGIETVIVDGLKDNLSTEALLQVLLRGGVDAVGITCLSSFYTKAVRLAQQVKKNNMLCILGGAHPTFMPYQTLRDSAADFVICGEAELALLKLASNGFVNNKIRGVYSQDDLRQPEKPTLKAEVIEDLDDLPFPDWQQMPPNLYPRAPHGALVKNYPVAPIITSRGCPYACTFCTSPMFYDHRIRFRSPENVIAEITYLRENFGVKEIHFEDDNLTLNREHVERIATLVINNGINVSWACPNGIRADKIDAGLIGIMRRSGCYYLAYGIESANPKILNNVKKRESINTIEKAIHLADEAKISSQGFFIFGLPGETPDTIKETIMFAKRTKLARAQFLLLDVLPGSELWNQLQGKFEPNWDKDSYREPEWVPEGLTKRYLMEAQEKAFHQFYLRPATLLRLCRLVDRRQLLFLLKRLRAYRLISWRVCRNLLS